MLDTQFIYDRSIAVNYTTRWQPHSSPEARSFARRAAEILDGIRDFFFALDRDWRFTYVNKGAAERVGLSPAQLTGENIFDGYPALRATEVERAYRTVMRDRAPTKLEHIGVSTSAWYEIRVFPADDGGIFVHWKDITERRLTEKALRHSEQRLAALILANTNVVFRVSPDWSSMTELHGRSFLADTEGPNAGWLDKYILPDDQAFVTGVINECIGEKKAAELEHRVIQRDGTVGWIHSRAVPLLDEAGRITEWFGAASNITGRIRAREALEQAHALLRGIMQSTTGLVAAFDTDFRYLAINEAYIKECRAIYGMEVQIGDDLMEMLASYPDDQKNACEVLVPAFQGRSVATRQIYGDPGRSRRVYELHVSPIRDSQGNIIGAAHINTEITEQAGIEEALREADRQKNRFLATLSHELRNPLATIRASLDLLQRVPPGGEQAGRAVTVIDRQCDQLARLVDDLLDVSRITQHKVVLELERLDMNELLRRVLEDLAVVFETSGLVLVPMLDPSPITLIADRARLAQVFDNLLQNAVKFTPRGGRVTVCSALDTDARTIAVRIADTGIGIEPEMIPQLFKAFSQLDTGLDRHRGGLGLGLALVKGIVELHGGEVSVSSAGPGHGTEFVVTLPWKAVQEVAPEYRPALAGRCRRILIIEDNVDLAETLQELLRLYGHEVVAAHSGPEGMLLASQRPPEVLVCDIGLPGMDGFAVARAFRENQKLKNVFLVALTGYALPEDVDKATAAGFDRHLAKPVDAGMLQRILVEHEASPDRSA